MKILISTGIYPPDIGGPATYSKLLYDELPKYNIEVSIISFGEVRKIPKIFRHIIFLFKLLNKAKNVDMIFAQDTVSVGFPSLLASKILRKKFFVRVPGDYAWEQSVQRYGVKETLDDFQNKKYGFRVELLRKIQKKVVNGAYKVITPSNYFKSVVSDWLKNKNKVFCIYNGIDLSSIPENLGNIETKTIISAGRLVPWKGFSALIVAMKSLSGWKLYIAGDGPFRKELEKIAIENNVNDRVFFLGQISRSDLINKIQKSDVFVLNTSFESFSFQIVEAMAAGIPVISTNIGNLAEIIDNGKNGILLNTDDIENIVSSCIRLSSDTNFRKLIIDGGKLKAQNFSIENTIKNLLVQIKND